MRLPHAQLLIQKIAVAARQGGSALEIAAEPPYERDAKCQFSFYLAVAYRDACKLVFIIKILAVKYGVVVAFGKVIGISNRIPYGKPCPVRYQAVLRIGR